MPSDLELLIARAEKFLHSGDTRTDEARHLVSALLRYARQEQSNEYTQSIP